MTSYDGDVYLGQLCSGNGMLPDGPKPLPRSLLSYHQWSPITITWGKFHERYQPPITEISWKITFRKFQSNLTGTNEIKFQLELPAAPFYWYGLNLISAWISNHMPNKVCNEITYPFPNFNGCTVEAWEWMINFIPHFIMDVIIHPCWGESKRGHMNQ